MTIKTEFHANKPDDQVRAFGSGESVFLTATRGEVGVTIYTNVAKARAIVASLTAFLAEHDLIAEAKAKAREAA